LTVNDQIRALIIEDSASLRLTLSGILGSDPEIEVIGGAPDPETAARRIVKDAPDVILLSLDTPGTDRITFLRSLMTERPIPVVMCTALSQEDCVLLLQALSPMTIDIIHKPPTNVRRSLQEMGVRICKKVKAAAMAGRRDRRRSASASASAHAPPPQKNDARLFSFPPEEKLTADVILPPPSAHLATFQTTEPVVCIGASTGGTESLRVVLEALPADCPGVVIVQHMPEKFTGAFAKRLDGLCRLEVREATEGDAVHRGRVLIAPGNRHTLLQRRGAQYFVSVREGPLVSRHRPSVDVLFRSAAQYAGRNATGVIMTGMGDDGARGMLEMHTAGASTIAQDEATSVVFGMPKEAIALGGVDKVAPLQMIPEMILRAVPRGR
jgi:two-component system, chemotaxis family, protein-glutamate methylesterase/glutaminase